MNEERTMILKMLKDGKITIEEAEALMEVIEESERTEAEKGAGESESGTGSANSARNADSARNANSTRGAKGPRPESGGSGQEEWWSRLFPRGADVDFTELNRTLKETLGTIRASVEEAVSGLGNLNLAAEINRALGNVKAECVQEAEAPEGDWAGVRLKNRWGDISVLTDDAAAVRVRAICTAWGGSEEQAKATLSHLKIQFERQEDTLVLSALRDHTSPFDRIRVDYEVTVPKSTALTLGTGSGDVVVSDLTSAVSISSLSGDIRASDVTGTQRYLTKSGDITLERVDGEVKANTMSGDVRVKVAPGASLRVSAATLSGEISNALPLTNLRSAKDRLDGELNDAAGTLSLRTASGDISLGSI